MISALYQVGKNRFYSHKNTSHALKYVRTGGMILSSDKKSSTFIVLVSNGQWSDKHDIKEEIKRLSLSELTC